MDPMDLSYAVIGIGALLAGVMPRLVARRPLSVPIAFLLLGMLVFAVPSPLPDPDPLADPALSAHITELGVMVALMGAGLKLDRPFGRDRWSSTGRLLLIAMPLGILSIALLGWWALGLAPAGALLIGAALAPTDPVLASDVQVGEPSEEEDSEDEVRFTLTSEAGLNDGLAFPFVYAAVAMATMGAAPGAWTGHWLAVDVAYKLTAGLVFGLGTGWLIGRLSFRPRARSLRLAEHAEGFVALAATFLSYGVTEVAGGYGFVAVFVCACTIRASERASGYHTVLHDFIEQIERLLTVGILLLFGGAIVGGLLGPLTWQAVALATAVVFVVRPATCLVALVGSSLARPERGVIAFFGIRGIGSFYYVSYALAEAEFARADLIWATTGLVVVISVVTHGITASPVMTWFDNRTPTDTDVPFAPTPAGSAPTAPRARSHEAGEPAE
ncbi:cation:proton antiporter [Embleya sp. NPDC008237]|uniref:cation:proton antiporter n=1 Tax=Embleya sp. NPDC008237 TaxID=3363978 RepID=UPI0036DFDC93